MSLLTFVFLLYLGATILTWLKNSGRTQMLLVPALIGHAWVLVSYSLQFGRLPVFNSIETLSFTAFAVGLLTLISYWRNPNQISGQRWALVIVVLLLVAALLWPSSPPCFDYNHSYSYAVAFHLFRRLALALSLFASALFLSALVTTSTAIQSAAQLRFQGRNTIMVAVLFYLLSEDVGIIWCLRGWGDIWHWSSGFMISTMVLVYLMLALHLPGGSRKPGLWYSLVGFSCGPLLFIAQFYKP